MQLDQQTAAEEDEAATESLLSLVGARRWKGLPLPLRCTGADFGRNVPLRLTLPFRWQTSLPPCAWRLQATIARPATGRQQRTKGLLFRRGGGGRGRGGVAGGRGRGRGRGAEAGAGRGRGPSYSSQGMVGRADMLALLSPLALV